MIKSIDLYNMIKENLGQTEIIEKNLEDVKNLTLKRYKLNGKINDIDLDELKLFKNIETLMLSNFSIQTKDLENINEKKELDAIQFSSCDFENIIPINSNISYIVLDHCQNVQLELINNNKIVRIIGAKFNLKNLDNFSKIEKLCLQDCAINNIEEIAKCKNLKYLNLDGSLINNTNFIDDLGKNILVSYKKLYQPMEENSWKI